MVKRRGTLVLIALGVVSLVLLWGWSQLKKLDYFNLRRVDIRMESRVSKEEIVELAGLHLGQNIFSLDLEEVRKRIEAHPWVARAFVSRKLPDTIFIRVEEEQPVAMVSFKKEVFLVNAQGRLFAPATAQLMKELPALTGLSEEEFKARNLSPRRKPVLSLLVRLKKDEGLVPCYANISQIKFLSDGFVLLTRDAIRVRFKGESLEDFLRAYRQLDRIMAYLYRTKQYARVKAVRLDYPEGQAALIFREG
ncbi:MAG: FtsQ-type POTRA domain-containing protein [Thermodesulfobacteria bacterium]|nr:FtsQ-type POTRA domain-containing protein [Thermodesulfobacteriota bacterium]